MGAFCTGCRWWNLLEGNCWKSSSKQRVQPGVLWRQWPLEQLPFPPLGLRAPTCFVLAQLFVSPASESGLQGELAEIDNFIFLPLGCVWGWESGYTAATGMVEWDVWVGSSRGRAWVTAPESTGTAWRTPLPGILATPPAVNHPVSSLSPPGSASLAFCCLKLTFLLPWCELPAQPELGVTSGCWCFSSRSLFPSGALRGFLCFLTVF